MIYFIQNRNSEAMIKYKLAEDRANFMKKQSLKIG